MIGIARVLAVAFTALLLSLPAHAETRCKFEDPGKDFSVQGPVVYTDATNSAVAALGYRRVVAINDKQRGCVAYVQAKRASGCAAGKVASTKGTTFVVPFTPVILAGADSVACR